MKVKGLPFMIAGLALTALGSALSTMSDRVDMQAEVKEEVDRRIQEERKRRELEEQRLKEEQRKEEEP